MDDEMDDIDYASTSWLPIEDFVAEEEPVHVDTVKWQASQSFPLSFFVTEPSAPKAPRSTTHTTHSASTEHASASSSGSSSTPNALHPAYVRARARSRARPVEPAEMPDGLTSSDPSALFALLKDVSRQVDENARAKKLYFERLRHKNASARASPKVAGASKAARSNSRAVGRSRTRGGRATGHDSAVSNKPSSRAQLASHAAGDLEPDISMADAEGIFPERPHQKGASNDAPPRAVNARKVFQSHTRAGRSKETSVRRGTGQEPVPVNTSLLSPASQATYTAGAFDAGVSTADVSMADASMANVDMANVSIIDVSMVDASADVGVDDNHDDDDEEEDILTYVPARVRPPSAAGLSRSAFTDFHPAPLSASNPSLMPPPSMSLGSQRRTSTQPAPTPPSCPHPVTQAVSVAQQPSVSPAEVPRPSASNPSPAPSAQCPAAHPRPLGMRRSHYASSHSAFQPSQSLPTKQKAFKSPLARPPPAAAPTTASTPAPASASVPAPSPAVSTRRARPPTRELSSHHAHPADDRSSSPPADADSSFSDLPLGVDIDALHEVAQQYDHLPLGRSACSS